MDVFYYHSINVHGDLGEADMAIRRAPVGPWKVAGIPSLRYPAPARGAMALFKVPKRSREEKLAHLTPAQRRQLDEIRANAKGDFEGDLDDLESALGMLEIGHDFGWKVLYIIHSKRTIRKYEEIPGNIKIREIFDETGPSSADYGNELVVLDYVESMPPEILEWILAKHPQFENRESKTAEANYYTNTCLCGAHFGDFFLHHEPGGAFFPNTEKEAGLISIEELPLKGVFDFDCGYGVGIGYFIFEHARRLP